MHSFKYKSGRLKCESVDLAALAEEHGTPLYVYSSETIISHYRRLDKALSDLDRRICFAVKANSNLGVLHLLAREGAGFDIVSGGELYRVLKAGGKANTCTFAGVCKTEEEMVQALNAGIYSFNIESEPELDRLNAVARRLKLKAPVAVRVNPDVEADTHKYISTGKSENKFGIPLSRAEEFYARASKMPGIHLRGVQMHIGSQITKPTPFSKAIRKMLPFVTALRRDFGIESFSVGGGIGIVYEQAIESGAANWWKSSHSGCMTLEDYASVIVPSLTQTGLKILFEPGRLIVGNAGVLISRVHYIKEAESKTFVIVDAGMNDLIRPALYESHHDIVPVIKRNGAKFQKVDVVGPVCESGDFFAQNRLLPTLRQGDLVAILSAGAYGAAMGSNYNSRTLPAEILVDGQHAHLVRKRQSFADLIRGEYVPKLKK